MYEGANYPGSTALFMPAHNEAGNIESTVRDAVMHLEDRGQAFVVIVVNDGSTDSTGLLAEGMAAEDRRVRVVHHPVNQGYGAALRSGFRAALETGYDYVAFCDSDGQFRASSFDDLFEALLGDEADIAIGYRINRADGLKRRLMGRGWHHISSQLLGFHVTDVDCGFKLFARPVVEKLEPMLNGNYATISPEMLMRAQRAGFRIAETGIPHYPRQHGEQSGASLRVIVGSFRGLWELRSSMAQDVVT